MNLRSSTPGSDRPRHMSLFLQRFGSEASRRTHLESQLVDLVGTLGGHVDYAGIGGAPYFERWMIVTVPSETAYAQMDAGITRLATAADGRCWRRVVAIHRSLRSRCRQTSMPTSCERQSPFDPPSPERRFCCWTFATRATFDASTRATKAARGAMPIRRSDPPTERAPFFCARLAQYQHARRMADGASKVVRHRT